MIGQKLWDHMHDEHGLMLLESELADIRDAAFEPSLLTADNISHWAKLWLRSNEWKEQQLPQYSPNIAHLLRVVADIIETEE